MNDNLYDPDHPTRQTWWLGTEGDNRRRLVTSTWDLRPERHRLMLDACLRAETEGDANVALEILDVDSPIEIDPVTAEHILYGSPSKKLPLWLEALEVAATEGRLPVGISAYGPTGFCSDL